MGASKRFRNKTCIYCQLRPSITQGDHVFAREFLAEDERPNPIKVPACKECNTAKSALETELTTVLMFGAKHAQAVPNFLRLIERRLAKNARLSRQLSPILVQALADHRAGKLTSPPTFPLDGDKLLEWVRYIAIALSWHHWQALLPAGRVVRAAYVPDNTQDAFLNSIASLDPHRVVCTVGKNAFRYSGAQDIEGRMSVWVLEALGGITLANSERPGLNPGSLLYAITAERSFFQQEGVPAVLALPRD